MKDLIGTREYQPYSLNNSAQKLCGEFITLHDQCICKIAEF